jgi:hypothetical protein
MSALFFKKPLFSSTIDYSSSLWELHETGQTTREKIQTRWRTEFIINGLHAKVDKKRPLPIASEWGLTLGLIRLLQYSLLYKFMGTRPIFFQVEKEGTAIHLNKHAFTAAM